MFRPRFLTASPLFALLAIPGFAQSTQTAQPATQATSDADSKTPAPPKKVWTNDDVHKNDGVSVVGDRQSQKYHMTGQQPPDPATISRIRTKPGKAERSTR